MMTFCKHSRRTRCFKGRVQRMNKLLFPSWRTSSKRPSDANAFSDKFSISYWNGLLGNVFGTGFLFAALTGLPALSGAQTNTPAGPQTAPQTTPATPQDTKQDVKPGAAPLDGQLPVKPPPVPTGVIPLPQGPPPTTPQAPVPSPAQPLPKSDQPLRVSPDLNSINGYVQDRAITLQDAVAIALYTNRNFASAVAALLQTQGRAGQGRSALNPTLSASADITEYDAATVANFGAFLGGGTTGSGAVAVPPVTVTPQFFPVLTATLALPLDVSGSLRAAASQFQFQEVAARIDVNRVRNEVVYNVKNAFYNVLRAQAQIAVATDSLNNALNRLNDANKTYAAGTSPRFDVISAQRDVANAQQDLINARAQLSVNLAALKNTIGINLRTRLRVSDQNAVDYPPGVLPPTVPPVGADGRPTGTTGTEANPIMPPVTTPPLDTPQPVPAPTLPGGTIQPIMPPTAGIVEDTFDFGPEYDTLLQEALRTRPEILEGDAQIAAARRGIQYARRSQLPSLNLSLSDTYQPSPAAFARQNVGAVSLGVTLPIFDGGLARERVREARGVEATAQVNRRQSTDQVQVDVQQAYIALVQARSRVAVANVGLAQAREAFRLARVRYNAGVSQQTGISPQIELSNAQTTLAQAQSNQINALYDYNTARAQVDRAAGRFSFTAAAPGYPAPPSPSVRGVSH
jgi:outer membrane protein